METATSNLWRMVYTTNNFSLLAQVEDVLSNGGLPVARRALHVGNCQPYSYELRVPAVDEREARHLLRKKGF